MHYISLKYFFPHRSLVNYEENSYSPIQPDQEPDSGPVDPVFVDEESSGEAVANAGELFFENT